MARYSGKIGYILTVETDPGVWEDTVVERTHYGDVLKNNTKYENSGGVNDNINISNTISIVADSYAVANCHHIKYAWFMGVKWKVTSIEYQHPRLLLILGGEYNG